MNDYLEIVNAVGIVMIIIIVVIYSLATYWNIRFLLLSKGKCDCALMVYASASTFIFLCIYIYLLVKALMGDFHDTSLFGSIVIRPAVLLLGGSIASMARSRYLILKRGGVQWILPKYKE